MPFQEAFASMQLMLQSPLFDVTCSSTLLPCGQSLEQSSHGLLLLDVVELAASDPKRKGRLQMGPCLSILAIDRLSEV